MPAPPSFKRPRRVPSPEEIEALVAMRDQGATWREIGRVAGKQDGACKRLYAQAVNNRAASNMTMTEEEASMTKAA
jgi:hypothetical protein